MPIRMTDDPQQDQPRYEDDNGGSGGGFNSGGGGGFGLLLPLLFGLFRSKAGLGLLVVAGIAYFVLGRGGCTGAGPVGDNSGLLKTGGYLDPRQFARASIYEPLAEDNTKNPLPESANLQKFAPEVGNQGQQGSCVAWSSAYAARSILEAARSGQAGNQVRFSPSFLYNQIGLDGCDGSYIERAMEFMTRQGSVPYADFPYSDKDCSNQPDQRLMQEAGQYKMRGFNRLSDGDRTDKLDLTALKQHLAQGAPVAIGMMVGPSFMQEMMGKDLWQPSGDDASMQGFGGHALCVVGYDDAKYGGSFLLMNSWGPQWGTNGFAWVQYPVFRHFVKEAYGLEPMQAAGAAASAAFSCEIGLVPVTFGQGNKVITNGYISLQSTAAGHFNTVMPVKTGQRFKVEVKNSGECYVYIFGRETDGTSYTLFPYPSAADPAKSNYSPFCGIAGYRLFPRDKSLAPDSIGRRDMIAVVVSRKPLDWYRMNTEVSRNPTSDYAGRWTSELSDRLNKSVTFGSNATGTITFSTPPGGNDIVSCMVEIDKK